MRREGKRVCSDSEHMQNWSGMAFLRHFEYSNSAKLNLIILPKLTFLAKIRKFSQIYPFLSKPVWQ